MWAVATRSEPSESVDIVRNAWSSGLDPRIPPEQKELGLTSHSKMIIEACKPFAWADKFPRTSSMSIEETREIENKWNAVISGTSSTPGGGKK
jgi:4-hydroxy-3-polyprenylbenzoate decarboxylase